MQLSERITVSPGQNDITAPDDRSGIEPDLKQAKNKKIQIFTPPESKFEMFYLPNRGEVSED